MMKTLRDRKSWLAAVLALILTAGLALAAEVGANLAPSATVHYKMTVMVETPEGIKTGSAVREVHLYIAPSVSVPGFAKYPPAGYVAVKGEAVTVDLGKRGKLFAILRGGISGPDYAYRILFKSFPWHGGNDYGGALTAEGIKWYGELKEGKKTLEPYDYPDMVMFKDPNDPRTVQLAFQGARVYHSTQKFDDKITDNMEGLFGNGVKVKSVTIEVTQEPVTWGVKKYLPWLKSRDHILGYLGSSPSQPFIDLSKTYLNGSEFSAGEGK